MPTEIELKVKIEDFIPLRTKLKSLGAKRISLELETNNFFDAPDKHLQKQDRGLRIRVAINQDTNQSHCTVTMKGPLLKGPFKEREEIEFTASDPAAVQTVFENLGFNLTLSFEKRRESWDFAECSVVLDELPYLGKYVEIEGKTEALVTAARNALGLENLPSISSGYISLLSRYLDEHKIANRHIRF